MIILVTSGVLAISGVVWLFISDVRDRVTDMIKSTRSPRDLGARDLGAMMLVERFGQPIPMGDDHNVTWVEHTSKKIPFGAFSSSEAAGISRQDTFATMEGVAQGAWFGMSAIQNLTQIDEHVYTAMGTLAGEQLDTIGDLSKYLSSWESAEMGEALPEAALAKLMGHLAEPIVAQNLEDLGMQVEMPDLSNQEGYDLVLNGEYFANVKTVADSSSLAAHFASYPQIPVIVPGDMAGMPENAIDLGIADSIEKLDEVINFKHENIVLVDNTLSYDTMLEHAEAVSDGLLGIVDISGIPFVTFALSGTREIRLLVAGKTNKRNAGKNLSLDLAGTGGGGAAGAYLLATIGTLILPGLGTVAGAFAGGVGGAVIGRKLTNSAKERPLKKALEKYEKASQKAHDSICSLGEEALRGYNSSVQIQENDLARSAADLKNELMTECARLIDDRRHIYQIETNTARKQLRFSLTELNNERQSMLDLATPKWKPVIYGRSLRKSLQEQVEYLAELSRRLESEALKIIKASSGQALIRDQALQFLQLLHCAGTETSSIRGWVQNFERSRKRLETSFLGLIQEKRYKLAKKRFRSMKKLSEDSQSRRKEVENGVSAILQELKPLSQKVEMELKKLGKKKWRRSEGSSRESRIEVKSESPEERKRSRTQRFFTKSQRFLNKGLDWIQPWKKKKK